MHNLIAEEGLAPAPAAGPRLRLSERRTPELVIALVGPVGSGASTAASILKEVLETQFEYSTFPHKLSRIIVRHAHLVGEEFDDTLKGAERIIKLQDIGNKLRENFGPQYLAEKTVEQIATIRLDQGGYKKEQEPYAPLPMRAAHIIDSLKNPAEVALLRDVYGETLWVVGVFAPQDVRRTRLQRAGIGTVEFHHLIERDEDEALDHGQRVRQTIFESDFFIRNDGMNDVHLKHTIGRYLDVLFSISVHTPTKEEAAMYVAVSAASNSACLSRQVGAAIYSVEGNLVGVGANDVPKQGGGLYTFEDGEKDHRCFKWGGKICHNDDRKERLYRDIFEKLKGCLVEKVTYPDVRRCLMRTDIRNLIEYSRSVHAEMEAIVSAAREGNRGLVRATMYTTTFPCHNCARHIIASGIGRVVYIEPYTKSLALELHNDAISLRQGGGKVEFLQYDGVAPKNVVKLFKHGQDRKVEGVAITKDRRSAVPLFQPLLDGFAVREQLVVKRLAENERVVQG